MNTQSKLCRRYELYWMPSPLSIAVRRFCDFHRICYKDKYIQVHKDSDFDTTDVSLLYREGMVHNSSGDYLRILDGANFINQRCKSYENEEPKTIEWIESFADKSIFYDVGSNIGGYSFIASMIHENIKVYSFEPNFMNFYIQVKTCLKNNVKNVFSFNLAINNKNAFDYFKYDIVTNGSKGTFGEELKEKMLRSDYSNPFKRKGHCLSATEIGTLGISLDTLVYDFGLEAPNYLKIDVDGNELLILQGAKQLLKDDTLKQIFIEIDDKIYDNSEIEKFMKNYSFDSVLDINLGTDTKPMRMVLYKR